MKRSCRVGLLLFVVVLTGVTLLLYRSSAPAETPPRPRLAVLLVFDQMRGDYLARWEKLYGEDGFRRLLREGAWFQNCHYPYAVTETGAGHASLLTGCSADRHGILSNHWYDRTVGDTVYCATTDHRRLVPPPDKESKKEKGAGSPERLLAPTLGDALKDATGGQGRVVSLSFKDRSAVLTVGRRADAVYWVDDVGRIVTSTYYRDRPHAWADALNRERYADRWFAHTWTRLRDDLDYTAHSGPDDIAAEGTGARQGRTFPHPLHGGAKEPGEESVKALFTSPFGNELLLELVKRAVVAERLGSRDTPDLLSVSFSSNDPIGHAWGPDSHEVLDVTLRSDLLIKELLAFLDEKVGKGRYVLVLSADHGVAPIPEVARARGHDAARIDAKLLNLRIDEFLAATFGKPDEKVKWLEAAPTGWYYLNRNLIQERGLHAADVEKALARWLTQQPGIQAAYTRTQLLEGVPRDDVIGTRVRKSFHPDRSGDVAVVPKPYWQITSYLSGTGHSTPHSYDTHVPLVVFGPGVRAGVRTEQVTPQASAAILAQALGIKPPARAEAPVPEGLFAAP